MFEGKLQIERKIYVTFLINGTHYQALDITHPE